MAGIFRFAASFARGLIDIFHDSLCNRVIVGIRYKDCKFIAVKTGSDIDGPDTSDNHLGSQFDDFVPDIVTVIVIDLFEMVAVYHDEDSAVIWFHFGEDFSHVFLERTEVHHAGQFVDGGFFLRGLQCDLQTFLCLAQLYIGLFLTRDS